MIKRKDKVGSTMLKVLSWKNSVAKIVKGGKESTKILEMKKGYDCRQIEILKLKILWAAFCLQIQKQVEWTISSKINNQNRLKSEKLK